MTVAFVGPRNLAGIPWLTARGWNVEDAATKRARFVDATGVSDHATRMDAAMAAGDVRGAVRVRVADNETTRWGVQQLAYYNTSAFPGNAA